MTLREHATTGSIARGALGFAIVLAIAAQLSWLTGWIGVYLFVVGILFSIGLHEFGHFITAKKFGMKVHRFFIGFPPVVWSVQRGETEYGFGAVPLGGFVKIAGMNPFEDVPPEDRDRVFKAKKPWQRAIVLAAGSFTHFVLALVIIAIVFGVVGRPNLDAPTTTINSVADDFGGKPSPAKAAGIEPGDTVVSIAGDEVRTWNDLVARITAHAEKTIPVVVERDGARIPLQATPVAAIHSWCEEGTPEVVPVGPDEAIQGGYLGIAPRMADPIHPTTALADVRPRFDGAPSPAAAAGLRPGDRVVAYDGTPVTRWNQLVDLILRSAEETVPIDVVRDGRRLTLTATPARVTKRCPSLAGTVPADEVDSIGTAEVKIVGFLGLGPEYETIRYGFFGSIGEAGTLIGRGVVDSLKGIRDLFSPSRIGHLFAVLAGREERTIEDPTTIIGLGQHAGGLGRAGAFDQLFLTIAAFNIFIGVANLLPLPPLDGGHLAVLAWEKLRRREVDMRRLMPVTGLVILVFGSLFLLLLMIELTSPIPTL